jgi:hypothetical protein
MPSFRWRRICPGLNAAAFSAALIENLLVALGFNADPLGECFDNLIVQVYNGLCCFFFLPLSYSSSATAFPLTWAMTGLISNSAGTFYRGEV